MNTKPMLFLVFIFSGLIGRSQMKIGDNPTVVSPGSLLELESTNKALTLPRLTTVQMQAIPSPMQGMIVFNTDSNCIYLYKSGNQWTSMNIEPDTTQSKVRWPYHTNNRSVGIAGDGTGIISVTGSGLQASGSYSHAEGKDNVASGDYSWSSGRADTASGNGSVAMGSQNKTNGLYSFSTGFQNVAAYQSSVALGQENRDSGWASMAMGLRNRIYNTISYSNVFGYANEIRSGAANMLSGESNVINSGNSNIASGYGNSINGSYNQLFGKSNRTNGGNAHILGGDNNVVRSGNSNAAFGYSNQLDGNYLGAIGKENSVFYQSGVALGQSNADSGYASIAGGLSNVVSRYVQYSSLFGYNNIAARNLSLSSTSPGSGLFSAGISNFNSGYASVALGSYNRSTAINSLAANYKNLSNSYCMSAFGHFNDTVNAYPGVSYQGAEMLFAIGNGTGENNRRNSFTMMRNGFTAINTTSQAGPNEPRAELDVKGTGAIIVPVGTSDQRPQTPVTGMIRFCTDCPGGPVLQGYDGTSWVNL